MQAPVYRNIETASTLLGLSFPNEVMVVVATFWASAPTLPAPIALAITLGAYVGVRAIGYRKPAQFIQHWILFQVRRRLCGGRLSCVARAPAPRFPHAPYRHR